jgi:CBS domain-containing protein
VAGDAGSSGRGEDVLDARARLERVEHVVARSPVTCPPSTSIGDVAALMARERISSVLIPHADGIGIVTDRDLRARVVAARRDPEIPVSEVMTPAVRTIPGSAMLGEAVLVMLEGGFHHVPVTDGAGDVIGVVTDTDLIGIGRNSPFLLKRAIERAADPEGAIAVVAALPGVIRSMVQTGVDPVDVGYAVALMTDALSRRVIELRSAELGSPPVGWAWLALGSEARREQGLHSDQDHAIAYDLPAGSDADEVDRYFASLAEAVTADLEAAGIPRCEGEVMATERPLRRSLEHWTDAFRGWMQDLGTGGSFQASIVFDYRRIAGTLDVEPALDEVLADAPRHPSFGTHLARRALDTEPPLGMFDRVRTERRGSHAGTIDVKHRGVLIVTGIARAITVGRGITSERGTVGRLRAAGGDVLDDATVRELEEAFRFLWGIRLRHQVERAAAGAEADDHVDPGTLGPTSVPGLREAFRVIRRAQRVIAIEFGIRAG